MPATGGILAHGIPAVHHWTEDLADGGGLVGRVGPTLANAAVGVAAGAVLVGLPSAAGRIRGAKPKTKTKTKTA
jgi:predicted DNA repair protein MutK